MRDSEVENRLQKFRRFTTIIQKPLLLPNLPEKQHKFQELAKKIKTKFKKR